jgi:hypothetical protein
MNQLFCLLIACPFLVLAGFLGSIWSRHRRRAVRAVIANPGAVQAAWVAPPDEQYAVHRLLISTPRGCEVAAVHEMIRRVLPQIEEKGIKVANVPDWCRDASLAAPVLELDEDLGGTFSFVVNGIISPVLLISILAATVWAAISA